MSPRSIIFNRVAAIRNAVADTNGKPIPRTTVLINHYESGYLERDAPSTTTDEGGRYELRFELSSPVTMKVLWISRPRYVRLDCSERFQVKPEQQVSLDFRLQPDEIIAGAIKPPGARRDSSNRIFILWVTGDKFGQIHVTDSKGRFKFYVPVGEYSISDPNFPKVFVWSSADSRGNEKHCS